MKNFTIWVAQILVLTSVASASDWSMKSLQGIYLKWAVEKKLSKIKGAPFTVRCRVDEMECIQGLKTLELLNTPGNPYIDLGSLTGFVIDKTSFYRSIAAGRFYFNARFRDQLRFFEDVARRPCVFMCTGRERALVDFPYEYRQEREALIKRLEEIEKPEFFFMGLQFDASTTDLWNALEAHRILSNLEIPGDAFLLCTQNQDSNGQSNDERLEIDSCNYSAPISKWQAQAAIKYGVKDYFGCLQGARALQERLKTEPDLFTKIAGKNSEGRWVLIGGSLKGGSCLSKK